MNKRIWWACYIFGGLLALISSVIGIYPGHWYFFIISFIFLGIHFYGMNKLTNPQNKE